MPDIVLDLPLPPTVNAVRKINWASYPKYKQWREDADKTLMLYRQNKQSTIPGAYEILIEVGDTYLRGDLDNILKQLIDYCVSREFVSGDQKRYLRDIRMRFVTEIPEACRVTIRSLST